MNLRATVSYYSNLLRVVNRRRLANAIAVELKSAYGFLNNSSLNTLPWAASVEPVNTCNLRCPQCPTGLNVLQREKGRMNVENFEKILDALGKQLIYITLYFQGEPLLHHQFIEMVKIARKRKIVVATSTNGQLIDKKMARELVESGLNRIIISLDGLDQPTYEKYRKSGDFQKVVNALKYLTEAKKESRRQNPFTEVQFLVMKHNEQQISEFRQFAKRHGADKVSFKTIQAVDFATAAEFLPKKSKWNRYTQMPSGDWKLKKIPDRHCRRIRNTVVVAHNGDVLPCCYDKDGSYVMGNLLRSNLATIWHGEAFGKFRKEVYSGSGNIKICSNCGG